MLTPQKHKQRKSNALILSQTKTQREILLLWDYLIIWAITLMVGGRLRPPSIFTDFADKTDQLSILTPLTGR